MLKANAMRRIFPRKFQNVLRAVLLFGVLGGLLFSPSEGIRLFPFPVSESAPQTNAGWKGEPEYQENIHRFEGKPGNHQSKTPRGNPFHLSNDFISPKSARRLAAHRQKGFFPDCPQLAKSRLLTAPPGSRAPPFSL